MGLESLQIPQIEWSYPVFTMGLTGTIGSGKSTAASLFREAGCKILDADQTAREILHSSSVHSSLLEIFGKEIQEKDETISREKIAEIIFNDGQKRKVLNQLIHPKVQSHLKSVQENLPQGELLVYDVPLLFETGSQQGMDLTVVLSAPQSIRFERVKKRSGWSWEEFLRREESQYSAEKKQKLGDIVIMNQTTLDDLKTSVLQICSKIKQCNSEKENL